MTTNLPVSLYILAIAMLQINEGLLNEGEIGIASYAQNTSSLGIFINSEICKPFLLTLLCTLYFGQSCLDPRSGAVH